MGSVPGAQPAPRARDNPDILPDPPPDPQPPPPPPALQAIGEPGVVVAAPRQPLEGFGADGVLRLALRRHGSRARVARRIAHGKHALAQAPLVAAHAKRDRGGGGVAL